jgi:hypothetical protein
VLTKESRSAGQFRWGISFAPKATSVEKATPTWEQAGRRVTLRFQSVHALHEWTLMSVRPDTLDGFVGQKGLLSQRLRVQGVRFDCADTALMRTSSGRAFRILRPGTELAP